MRPTQRMASLSCDDRGLSSVVGKTLELGLLALYVGLLVSTFYGGALPEYRAAAGASVADRTAAAVATDVEGAVPPTDGAVVAVAVEREVTIPRTIYGDPYRLALDDGVLVLDHPESRLSRRIPLSLPDTVAETEGSVRSGETVVIVVESTPQGLICRLEGR